MKKCPYCAEMIQDEAIKCRYCMSDLTVAPGGTTSTADAERSDPTPASEPATASTNEPESEPAAAIATDPPRAETAPTEELPSQTVAEEPAAATAGSDPAAPPTTSEVRYTHSGYRYVLGYGVDFFGIWDRQSPSMPAERFTRTDDGWQQAWNRFIGLEPNHVAVPQAGSGAGTTSPVDNEVMQYTHSGQRYLLGYGRSFFGIWDRQAPATPVERFNRDDAGWAAAWHRYNQLETHYTEVGLSSTSGGETAQA